MLLHIAVCDDDAIQIEYLTTLTRKWGELSKTALSISSYISAESFMFAYETDKSADILLLDIHMEGIDGLTLAKKLRLQNSDIQIIFITGFSDFISEGYEVSALHYLMKPVAQEKLFSVLDRALILKAKTEEFLLLDTVCGQIRLLHSDIEYAEAFAHKTEIHTNGSTMESKLSISELEKLLGCDFCRIHRSYLAALGHIKQITKTQVLMDCGKAIPLSRRRYDEINRSFIRYYKGGQL